MKERPDWSTEWETLACEQRAKLYEGNLLANFPTPWRLGEQCESSTLIMAANGVKVCTCHNSFPFRSDHEALATALVNTINALAERAKS